MRKRGKRGLSPIIATVLLIALVVVIALLIFLWARNLVGEACEKGGAACEQRCSEINVDASRSGTDLYLDNKGNVAIYSLKVSLKESGSENIVDKAEVNLQPGMADTYTIDGMSDTQDVSLTMIVKGQTKSSEVPYTCTKNQVEVPVAS